MEIRRSYDRLISTNGVSYTGKTTSLYWIGALSIWLYLVWFFLDCQYLKYVFTDREISFKTVDGIRKYFSALKGIKASAFRAPQVRGLSEWRSVYIWQQASNTSLWQTTSQWRGTATHTSSYNLVIPEQATQSAIGNVQCVVWCSTGHANMKCLINMSISFEPGPLCTQWIVLSKNTTKDMLCSILHLCLTSIFITRVSEVIMFSPCVFVCLCLYHDVCPDDLTMKDWCHTNNILQVHCWGSLVVQVMFHALMTSSMTSPGYKVGQILNLTYLRQYLS